MTSKQKNTGTNSELSLNLNASFTIWPNKKAKIWVQKPRFANFWSFFFDIIFWRIFSLSFPRKPRGDDDGIHDAAEQGDVPALRHFLRVDPERVREKDPSHRRWPQSSGWIACSGGVVGASGRCQKKSNILKFGFNRNLDFSNLPFAPAAIRGKWTHEAGGTMRNKMGFFQGIMQHKTWQDITAEMDSTRRMWRHQSFFVHCTPMDPWELEPGFRQCYHLIDDIVLTGLITIEKAISIIYIFFHQK